MSLDPVVADLIYKLIQDYGIVFLCFIIYAGSIVYFLFLSSKERKQTSENLLQLSQSQNNLHSSVDEHMRQSISILTAFLASVSGNQRAAIDIVAGMSSNTASITVITSPLGQDGGHGQ